MTAAKRLLLPLLAACLLSGCPQSNQPPDEAPPLASVAPSAPAPAASPPEARGQVLPDFTGLVEAQGPAVVNVLASHGPSAGAPRQEIPEPFRRFIPDLPPRGRGIQLGLGSGFIVREDGLILTNAHLVAGATAIAVRLADGKREFPAKVLGADRRSDVALLKIEAKDLPVASLGTSAAVKPGEWVVAIGSPFGFSNTITAGIVSAVNRELPTDPLVSFIQTDVAVNPGNSGGPLINMAGQVIGINSMIFSGTGGYMGVSFAIPIEVAMEVARQLQSHGKVTRGSLRVAIQPVTEELAEAFHMKSPQGVLVSAVEPGGPADKAGIKGGDVILEYDGHKIEDPADLPRRVAASPPGGKVEVVVWRMGEPRKFQVKVGEAPGEKVAEAPAEPSAASEQIDLVIREVPPPMRQELGIGFGLLVEAVRGPADTPLRPGDVIIGVNAARFSSRAEFNRMLSGHKKGETIALLLWRRGNVAYVTVKMQG